MAVHCPSQMHQANRKKGRKREKQAEDEEDEKTKEKKLRKVCHLLERCFLGFKILRFILYIKNEVKLPADIIRGSPSLLFLPFLF